MTRSLLLPALLLSATAASAGAYAELLSLGGGEAPSVPAVRGAAVSRPAVRPVSAAAPITTSRTVWNAAFPVRRETVDAVGGRVFTKAFEDYRCTYTPGAATAQCDYAYDVWPEICWYGYDHVIVDITLADGSTKVVKTEWRSDR